MKSIKLSKGERFDAKVVLGENLKSSAQGMNVGEMRQRIKIIDKLEAANDRLILEDAEYETLRRMVESTKWAVADAELLQIIDDVLSFQSVPKEKGKHGKGDSDIPG